MIGWLQRLAILALAMVVMAYTGSTVATPSNLPSESRSATSGGAGPAPRLPTPEQERSIVQALETSGARVAQVSLSKFDWLFGNVSPAAAIFHGAVNGQEFWVSVHFLAAPLESLTACSNHGSYGETEFTVTVSGQPQVLGSGKATGYLASTGPMYFAASERHFVMTPHAHALDAVRRSLAVTVPLC